MSTEYCPRCGSEVEVLAEWDMEDLDKSDCPNCGVVWITCRDAP